MDRFKTSPPPNVCSAEILTRSQPHFRISNLSLIEAYSQSLIDFGPYRVEQIIFSSQREAGGRGNNLEKINI